MATRARRDRHGRFVKSGSTTDTDDRPPDRPSDREPPDDADEPRRSTDVEAGDDLTPAVPDEARPLIRYEDVPADLAEALRLVVNRYELRTGSPLPATIAVTSAVVGEGVTTVSQTLATIIALEMGKSVCWVDCAWMTAAASPYAAGRPSLVDILSDRSNVLSAFQSSPEVPQLMSLTPGPVPESKRNMIVRSPEYEWLLGILSDEFDHVVFDVPPVLSNASGLALLRRSDASLLVVKHRSTSINQVRRAYEATQPAESLGIVLNQVRNRIPGPIRRLLGE